MLLPNTIYRMGPRVLVYMMLRAIRYPVMFMLFMVCVFVLTHMGRNILIFSFFLSVSFGLIVIPEYVGLCFIVSDRTLVVRRGILSPRDISIPYSKIETVEMTQTPAQHLWGIATVSIKTNTKFALADTTFQLISKESASKLNNALLDRLTPHV